LFISKHFSRRARIPATSNGELGAHVAVHCVQYIDYRVINRANESFYGGWLAGSTASDAVEGRAGW